MRLFSSNSRPAEPPTVKPRLLRLVLMLALAIAVMRQLQEPQFFQALFPGLSDRPTLTPENLAALTTGQPLLVAEPSDRAGGDGAAADPRLRQQVAQTLRQLSDSDIIALIGELAARWPALTSSAAQSARPESPAESDLPGTVPDAVPDGESDADAASVWSEDWVRQLDRAYQLAIDGEAAEGSIVPPRWGDAAVLTALQDAVDDWLIDRTSAAAVWTGNDRLAFYRLLTGPLPKRRTAAASQASAVSLIQQPEAYLHRRVVLPGTVARSIRHDQPVDPPADSPFALSGYWEVWIRPDDGSARPVVIYTADVPAAIADVGADSFEPVGPDVLVDGVYLKRIAYQSQAGRELAPAIVGDLHLVQAAVVPPPADNSTSPPSAGSWWLILLGTATFGIALAGWLGWQANRARTRARRLRARQQQPLDL